LPPRAFVKSFCSAKHVDAAIVLFEKRARWTRGYIRMKEVDAVNTLGGPAGENKLVFAEEVIILSYRSGASGGMAVSGAGSYDVLRWDGTCATLADHELVTWVPATPQNAPITWKYLDESIQQALLQNSRVRAARDEHRRECRGASVGTLSESCERAVKKLNESIVTTVRAGLTLPEAEKFM
jgi:hypothetical protein